MNKTPPTGYLGDYSPIRENNRKDNKRQSNRMEANRESDLTSNLSNVSVPMLKVGLKDKMGGRAHYLNLNIKATSKPFSKKMKSSYSQQADKLASAKHTSLDEK